MTVQAQAAPTTEHNTLRKFTSEEYQKMYELGILDEDERLELLNGRIIKRHKQSTQHSGIKSRLMRWLFRDLSERVTPFVPCPIRLDQYNQVLIDVVVAKFREDDYARKELKPEEDIYFCIEVADKSLEKDRTEKMPVYATSKIPEYWIANLKDFQIEVFKQPKDGDYQVKEIYKMGDSVTCEEIDFTISVEDLFKYLKKNNSK